MRSASTRRRPFVPVCVRASVRTYTGGEHGAGQQSAGEAEELALARARVPDQQQVRLAADLARVRVGVCGYVCTYAGLYPYLYCIYTRVGPPRSMCVRVRV
jgi:hypothetical protein